MTKRKLDYSDVIKMYYEGESAKYMAEKQRTTINTINELIAKLKRDGLIKRRDYDKSKQGSRHNRAKLTEYQAKKIITLRLEGKTYKEIADIFKIHPTTPQNICTGKSWKHLFSQYKGKLEIISKRKKQ